MVQRRELGGRGIDKWMFSRSKMYSILIFPDMNATVFINFKPGYQVVFI